MRAPFGYESNVSIIRQILVPDHMTANEWATQLGAWKVGGKNYTLLEYLAREWKQQHELMGILGESLNTPVCQDPVYRDIDALDAVGTMLLNHGFLILGNRAERRLLTGGESIQPDLGRYLGEDAHDWQWVLVPPIRDDGLFSEEVNEARALPAKAYNHVIWLTNLLNGLWSAGVTDVHFEYSRETLGVRVKHAAGLLKTIGNWSDDRASAVIRLICRWAGISDWDNRSFVDGTLAVPGAGSAMRMRFSLIPTIDGWSMVMRSPAPSMYTKRLNELGLSPEQSDRIMDTIHHENGLILCTGSTGSGKTTTLYAIMKELQQDNLKIMTIEDPVEQELPHAVQSSVDTRNGWTFDKAVYAYLRQDPDIIMIGEIRDATSAEAACRAALTGHSVLSTMHAAEAGMVVQRFGRWGIPDGIIRDTVRLVISQRIRRNPVDAKAVVDFILMNPFGKGSENKPGSLHPADAHT